MLTCTNKSISIGADDGQYLKYQKIEVAKKDVSGYILKLKYRAQTEI